MLGGPSLNGFDPPLYDSKILAVLAENSIPISDSIHKIKS